MPRVGEFSKRVIILAGDLVAFQLALLLTITVRYGGFDQGLWLVNLPAFTVVSLAWVIGFYIAGLYELTLLREPIRLFRTYLEGMMANLAVALAFFYLLPFVGLAPRTILFLFFAISLLIGYGWRLVAGRFINTKFSRLRILYVGPAEELRKVDEMLRESSLGADVVAAIATSGEAYRYNDIAWLPGLHAFTDALKEHHITTVVLGVRPDDMPELKAALYQSIFISVDVLDRAEIEELATGRIPLSYVSEAWFLHHLRESEKTWFETGKRAADVVLAIPFGLLTALVYPFVAAGIKLASPGPVLYSQVRVGKGGKPFRIWKFRTMRIDAEKNGAQFTADAKTDPRLFGFGRFLRQTRVDELPQVWNVLMGDLSFIGPRPERPEFVNPLLERMPYYALRHLTRPGLTGWAQVRFLTPNASIEDNLKKLQYDLYYIKNRSILLDALILLKTIGVVLRRQGT